jgi:tetraacyldisaccharide 4'-kinase
MSTGLVKAAAPLILSGMFDTQKMLETISGKRRGVIASLIRIGLSALTPIYRLAIFIRNLRYDRAIANDDRQQVRKVDVPVISVGNITTGGSGKTPLVIWLAQFLRTTQIRVAVISRGYGADPKNSDGRNDEAMEMELRLPDVPHLQDPDRHSVASIAVEELESQVLLLDDGFQHRKLHRDLDIVLIDATNPFGYGRLLPRGLLREPISGLKRANAIVLTRCDLVDDQTIRSIRQRIENLNFKQTPPAMALTHTKPLGWLQFDGQQHALSHLETESLFAFCGIGNPLGFAGTLESLNLNVIGNRSFPDHHAYSRADLADIARLTRSAGASAIVCTHKDLVKVGCNQIEGLPVFALLVAIEFQSGQAELETIVSNVVKPFVE